MKIILHIGTHKTGTSAFQGYCKASQQNLIKDGIYWAERVFYKGKGYNQHSILAKALKLGDSGDLQMVHDFLLKAINAAESNDCGVVLLSGEAFSKLKADQIQLLKSYIPADVEVQIIVAFRNIYDYVASSITEHFKKTDQFLQSGFPTAAIQDALKYQDTVMLWEDSFSADSVTVLSYDQHKSTLLPTLFQIIGHQTLNHKFLTNPPIASVNASPDLATLLHWSMAGLTPETADYKMFVVVYEDIFKDFPKKDISPITAHICEQMIAPMDLNYDHPKLAPIKDFITKPPTAQPLSPAQQQAYLSRQALLFKRLSKPSLHHKEWIKKQVKSFFARFKK